jgi:hypothetical protein
MSSQGSIKKGEIEIELFLEFSSHSKIRIIAEIVSLQHGKNPFLFNQTIRVEN